MGVLADLHPAHGHLISHLDEAAKQSLAHFDAVFGPPAWASPLDDLVAGLDDDGRVRFARWVQLRLSLGWTGGHDYDERLLAAVRHVAGADLPWQVADVRFVWGIANAQMTCGHTNLAEVYRIPLAAIQHLDHVQRRRILRWDLDWYRDIHRSVWQAHGDQIIECLTEPEEGDPAAAVRNVIWDCDAFACVLATEYGERLAGPRALALLRHWNTARSSKPSGAWLRKAGPLLTPETHELVREILTRLAAYRETPFLDHWETPQTMFLDERTARPLRGMVWTCSLIDEPWVTPLLGDVALTCGVGMGGTGANCRSERLANAAVNVLARRGGLDTVSALARLQTKVRRKSVLANIGRSLDSVAAEAGLSREQLLDRTVPTYGLDSDGVREEKIGGYLVRLEAAGPALRYVNPAGKQVKSAPAAIRQEPALAELKAAVKELRQALPAERFRLERALITDRMWPWEQVTAHFLDHPVTTTYARKLIWRLVDGPAGIPIKTGGGWRLMDPAGQEIRPDPDSPVRLWHPIRETAGDVWAWRDHLISVGVRQPFKQAFREIYLLTPAEEQTSTHSNRFAGHVLRYGQAKALLNQRGWSDLAIGYWDGELGSDQGEAIKELSGWHARWGMHVTGDPASDGWGTAAHCVSEEIGIYRADQRVPRHYDMAPYPGVPLTEVPPLVLSEILRDADLAVGVTSVGLDVQPAGGHEDYWQSYGFGELTETAQSRRDALARLLPRLKITGRAEVTDRFLRVRGDLRTYKIHLGSGNILMEPNDAYLCIVAGADRAGHNVFLPFEEDGGMLSIILSKAFLLANDTAITDPTITRQLAL
ncbi:DUF4132 domain-containing protein [Streptosporangiaceae bacterium NEAU-GS5]|nr:DUF4132 domain-containing protein [Streptosporangiaceae bacterium NEAU-GS5]